MSHYADGPIKKYLEDLHAKLPAPGGGSSSALVAANGVALLGIVANFTLDRKGYEAHNEELRNILSQTEKTLKRLCELVDLDVEAYSGLSGVYKLPKNTGEERRIREERMQEALDGAMQVPYEIFRLSAGIMPLSARLCDIGNKNLVSDAGCGALFLLAAMKSAKLNVDINIKALKNRDSAGIVEISSFISQSLASAESLAASVVLRTYL